MPGGELEIEVREDWSIFMRGPVEEICSGTFSDDLISKIHKLTD
jgi:diaminopimelate epimerase